MKRFFPYLSSLKSVRGKFVFAILAGIIAGAAGGAGLPVLSQEVFPVIFASEETGKVAEAPNWLLWLCDAVGTSLETETKVLLLACLMLPTMFLIRGVFGYINVYLVNLVGLTVLEDLRLQMFGRLQELSLSFHRRQKGGDLVSRVMGDTQVLQNVLTKVGNDMIVQPCTLLGAIVALIVMSLQDSRVFFMLIALTSVPLCALPIRAFGRKLTKKARAMQAKLGDMTASVTENLASQREVRAYLLEEQQQAKFHSETSLFLKFQMKVVKYRQLISPSVEIVSAFAVSIAIYFGAKDGMTLEKFFPLLMALYMAYEPVKKLGNIHSAIKQGEAALDRIEYVLHSDDEIQNPAKPRQLGKLTGEIAFKQCRFRYEDAPILKSLDVTVPAGETVALVGESGVGKSTLVSLIARFYDVQEGAVCVDGVDVREVRKEELRSQIALVSQQPLLFSGSIFENIAIGNPQASEEQVYEAAKKAHAHHFIMEQPDGYQTLVGERGAGLSGGQCQRVAIARAFLKNAPILILDEATSALDAESEAQIQEQLKELAKGRTTFLIAHRFSTIRDADRIMVFRKTDEGGELDAYGSHQQVYETSGIYRELYDRQAG